MLFFRKKGIHFLSNDRILPIYNRQISFARQASSALREMLQTTDHSEWRRLEKEVKQCEIQGDAILAEFYEELYENLMRPMSRSDCQHIAMDIDDFIDSINSAAKSLLLYSPAKIDVQMSDIAQYIEADAEALRHLIASLSDVEGNFSSIMMQCDRITELEHAADDSYEEYIGYIFREEPDPIELIKYKNIAEALESSTDAAKRISDRLRTLLLRYK